MAHHTLSDHLERSISLYRSHFRSYSKYILLSAIPSLIQYIAIIGVGFITLTSLVNAFSAQTLSFQEIILPTVLTLLVNFVFGLFSLWISIAFYRTIWSSVRNGQSTTMRMRLKEATKLFFPTLGTTILYSIYTVGPILLSTLLLAGATFIPVTSSLGASSMRILQFVLIVGTIYGLFHLVYFSVRLFFSMFEVMVSGAQIREAFTTSKQLTKNHFWYVFLTLLVSGIGLSIVSGIVQSIFAAIASTIPSTIDNTILDIVFIIFTFFFFQIMTLISFSLYDSRKNPPAQTLQPEFEPITTK